MHNGFAPKGPANHQWKDGRRWKYLPMPVASLYREAANDPELLHARGTVALLEARARQLMQRLGRPESEDLWTDLKAAAEALEAAHQEPDAEARAGAVLQASDKLVGITNRGVDEEAAWRELRKVEAEKLHAQQAEWQRMRDLRQLATAEEVLNLVRAIAESVSRHVSSAKERLAIVNDSVRLTNADEPLRVLGVEAKNVIQ
jgi:hypothetical protein